MLLVEVLTFLVGFLLLRTFGGPVYFFHSPYKNFFLHAHFVAGIFQQQLSLHWLLNKLCCLLLILIRLWIHVGYVFCQVKQSLDLYPNRPQHSCHCLGYQHLLQSAKHWFGLKYLSFVDPNSFVSVQSIWFSHIVSLQNSLST